MAKLLAETASDALGGVNSDSGFGLADRGAADLQAHSAVAAFFGIANIRDPGLLNNESARTAGNDHGQLVAGSLFTDYLFKFLKIERIHDADVLNTHRVAKLDDIERYGRITVNVLSVCGIVLMPGHAGDRVVGNDDGTDGTVIRHVKEPGEAAVAEGGVAEDSDGLLRLLVPARFLHAVSHADRRAHADAGVDAAERRKCAERIAADIGANRKLQLAEHMI